MLKPFGGPAFMPLPPYRLTLDWIFQKDYQQSKIYPIIPRWEKESKKSVHDLNEKIENIFLSRYLLLRDMVKDATHHPDYKVYIEKNMKLLSWLLIPFNFFKKKTVYQRSSLFVKCDPPGILSRGKCFKRIVKEEERRGEPWNSADNFESKKHLYVKIHLLQVTDI